MTFAITFDLLPAALSIVGSLLVSRYDRWSTLGWACWLVANGLWIFFALTMPAANTPNGTPLVGIVAQNAFFIYTSIKGLINSSKRFAPSEIATTTLQRRSTKEVAITTSTRNVSVLQIVPGR